MEKSSYVPPRSVTEERNEGFNIHRNHEPCHNTLDSFGITSLFLFFLVRQTPIARIDSPLSTFTSNQSDYTVTSSFYHRLTTGGGLGVKFGMSERRQSQCQGDTTSVKRNSDLTTFSRNKTLYPLSLVTYLCKDGKPFGIDKCYTRFS